jgi:trk system potassium uptake protein TrkA
MYIIIIGGGRVGYYLAKALLKEGHEVLVIEENPVVCETINEELGSVCLRGDGCEVSMLSEAGTGRADMLVAVTRNEDLFRKLGIDVTISSTNVILEHITEEVPTHPVTHLMEIRDRGLEVVEVRVPAGSTSAGKAVKDLSLPTGSMLSLIIRKEQKPIVPTSTTVLMAGDQVIAVTPSASEEALRTALTGE